MCVVCGYLMVGFQASALVDTSPDAISIAVVKPVSSTPPTDSQEGQTTLHFIGGRMVDLMFVIRGHCEQPFDVRAQLVQRSVSLGGPVAEYQEVCSGEVLNDDGSLEVGAALTLPDVRDETEFDLQYQVRIQGTDWRDAGSMRVRLHSNKILAPLKLLSEEVVLRLKDRAEVLGPILEELEIVFIDHRAPVVDPDMSVLTLIVEHDGPLGGVDLRDLRVRAGESVVIFHERVKTLPKIVKQPFQAGELIQVELKILENLRDDPNVQKTFMEIIQLARPD